MTLGRGDIDDAHRNDLQTLLQSDDLALGIAISWGDGRREQLLATTDLGLHAFVRGVDAWLAGDMGEAAIQWQTTQQAGLTGIVLNNLLELVTASTNTFLTVYTDGSYAAYDRSGGAACVYQRGTYYGMLTRHLSGPLDSPHHAEAEAIRLAVTAPELADDSLLLYSDSITVINALPHPRHTNLGRGTIAALEEINEACRERDVEIQHVRSRTNALLHDQADKLAKWVRILGNDATT